MEREFISSSISSEQIIYDKSGIAEKYVLINNEASIKKIHNFFTSNKSILLINFIEIFYYKIKYLKII